MNRISIKDVREHDSYGHLYRIGCGVCVVCGERFEASIIRIGSESSEINETVIRVCNTEDYMREYYGKIID